MCIFLNMYDTLGESLPIKLIQFFKKFLLYRITRLYTIDRNFGKSDELICITDGFIKFSSENLNLDQTKQN